MAKESFILCCGGILSLTDACECVHFARWTNLCMSVLATQYLFELAKSIKMMWPRKWCRHRHTQPASQRPTAERFERSEHNESSFPFTRLRRASVQKTMQRKWKEKIKNKRPTALQARLRFHLNMRSQQINSKLIAFIFKQRNEIKVNHSHRCCWSRVHARGEAGERDVP